MKRLKTRLLIAPVIGAVVVGTLLAPAAAVAATQDFGALNCGSSLILSSLRENGTVYYHKHKNAAGDRVLSLTRVSGVYTWSYYNSGYTAVSGVVLGSNGTITNGSRSCDY